jgi:hypothetical protein
MSLSKKDSAGNALSFGGYNQTGKKQFGQRTIVQNKANILFIPGLGDPGAEALPYPGTAKRLLQTDLTTASNRTLQRYALSTLLCNHIGPY